MAGAFVDGLAPRQEQAILALLNEPTIQKASQACGVGERTIHRWLEDPSFVAVYRRRRREAFSHAIALTHRYAPLAVQTLAKVMTEGNAPYGARVSAAGAVLKFSRESLELDDLAARVEALERDAAAARGAAGEAPTSDAMARLREIADRPLDLPPDEFAALDDPETFRLPPEPEPPKPPKPPREPDDFIVDDDEEEGEVP